MDDTKSPLRSVTVVAAAASALVSLAGVLGVRIDPALASAASDAVMQLVSAGLAAIAVYGRVRANTRIGRGG